MLMLSHTQPHNLPHSTNSWQTIDTGHPGYSHHPLGQTDDLVLPGRIQEVNLPPLSFLITHCNFLGELAMHQPLPLTYLFFNFGNFILLNYKKYKISLL